MQFEIKGALFRVLFVHPWYLFYRKYFFDLKLAIWISVIIKWGPGGKIWDWYIILHYFAEYLTPMLTLGPHKYRRSNLVLDLKIWEKFQSNLPVWKRDVLIFNDICFRGTFILICFIIKFHLFYRQQLSSFREG